MSFLDRFKKAIGRTTSQDPFVADLIEALSAERVHFDATQRFLHSHDASVFDEGNAGPVCFPITTQEVQEIMQIAQQYSRPVVARGAGTGLAGGAIPLGEPAVIAMTKMNKILEIDIDNRVAWVEPGVINLDLSIHLQQYGYHFAPDPSSQQVCTIGGNVANNSGGPHCLAYGVTDAHVLALEVILPDGEMAVIGGLEPEPEGLDLRGAFIGSEGTLGITTKIGVRITKTPPDVRTLLLSFSSMRDAAQTVSAVIAAGIVPAAMEVMDQRITNAVESFVGAGYPIDAAAVLLVEVEGLIDGTEIEASHIREIGFKHGATNIRVADSEQERELLWKGRKTAFGAIAQIAPDYYLHDTVVPRSSLADVLEKIDEVAERYELIVMNVFHAGDGNLHPLLLFDAREEGMLEKVHAAGAEIMRISLDAGGVLSGEHGIGIEKQAYMNELFTDEDLNHQNRLRYAFDPDCRSNPGKVLPAGHSCADIQALKKVPEGIWG
ncbi:MAG: FAD-linked oxidase C-terminal domain-containing protein [Acidimicrobiales bacterium]|nr:FAD-linked oxidase C-terminal domain-containing protein [Acidimicrobiales bacterium]